jgi:hypothetical protein
MLLAEAEPSATMRYEASGLREWLSGSLFARLNSLFAASNSLFRQNNSLLRGLGNFLISALILQA